MCCFCLDLRRGAWQELIQRCEEAGVDGFEINFSCPHGMPERKMGMAMGQDCELLSEVCGWINEVATKPVWAKMTPNITDITDPARAALAAGCEGVSAINTITSVMGLNLDTLRPEPSVEGYTTPGGYSYKAVKPIALAKVGCQPAQSHVGWVQQLCKCIPNMEFFTRCNASDTPMNEPRRQGLGGAGVAHVVGRLSTMVCADTRGGALLAAGQQCQC